MDSNQLCFNHTYNCKVQLCTYLNECSSLFWGGYIAKIQKVAICVCRVVIIYFEIRFCFCTWNEIMETSASLTQQLDKLGSQSTTWKCMCSRIHQNIWVPLFQIPCAEKLEDPGLIHAFPRIFFEVLLDICSNSYVKCEKIVKWSHGPWSMDHGHGHVLENQ